MKLVVYSGVNQTTKRLGEFLFFCLQHDVKILDWWVFNKEHRRSIVEFLIDISEDKIDLMQDTLKVKTRPPTVLKLT